MTFLEYDPSASDLRNWLSLFFWLGILAVALFALWAEFTDG